MHMSSIFGPVKTQLNGKRQMGHMWSLLSMKRKLAGQQSPGGKHHMRIQGRHGPKISKHGVEMHCKYCNEAGHNQRGCKLKKAGLRPNQQPKKSIQNPEVITTEVMPSFIQWFPSKIKTLHLPCLLCRCNLNLRCKLSLMLNLSPSSCWHRLTMQWYLRCLRSPPKLLKWTWHLGLCLTTNLSWQTNQQAGQCL